MIEPRDGSSLYYSILGTEPEVRRRFLSALTLIQTLAQTLEDVQEPSVAEQKIHWWHQELERLCDGQAKHPATLACQPLLAGSARANQRCLEILSAGSTLRFEALDTDELVRRTLVAGFRARCSLLTYSLSDDPEDLELQTKAHLAALALGQYEQLSRLPVLLHRGIAVFSDETYRRHQVQPADLAAHIRVAASEDSSPGGETQAASLSSIPVLVEPRGRQALINEAIDIAHTSLRNAVSDRDTQTLYGKPRHLRPLWRLLSLREKQLALWKKERPDLLRERTSLTPIRKLMICWLLR